MSLVLCDITVNIYSLRSCAMTGARSAVLLRLLLAGTGAAATSAASPSCAAGVAWHNHTGCTTAGHYANVTAA